MNNVKLPFLALLVIALALVLLVVITSYQEIMIDEAFHVASDTSEYTCIISEADETLSLNCMKTK